MRSVIKFTRNEISFRHNKIYAYISFQKLCFDLLINYPCFYEKFTCANISFQMISFRGMYRNFISGKITAMKEHPRWVSFRGISSKQLQGMGQEPSWKYFRWPRNKISYKQPLNMIWGWLLSFVSRVKSS